MTRAHKLPRQASRLYALAETGDLLTRTRIMIAAEAVTGTRPETALKGVFALIRERKERQWAPTSVLSAAAAKALSRAATRQFWEQVDEAVERFNTMVDQLHQQRQPELFASAGSGR